jgi:LysM repeat protein
MSEGGLLAWKVQKTVTAPTLKYNNLQKELKAPKGRQWVFDSTNREWSLERVVPNPVVMANAAVQEDLVVDAVVVKSCPSSPSADFFPFFEHLVQSTDTFQGICIRYKITPTELRQANDFTGSNLFLAPNPLKIPKTTLRSANMVNDDNVPHALTTDQVVTILLKNCPKLSKSEAKAYLELNDWDIAEAVTNALEDGF